MRFTLVLINACASVQTLAIAERYAQERLQFMHALTARRKGETTTTATSMAHAGSHVWYGGMDIKRLLADHNPPPFSPVRVKNASQQNP